MSLGKNGKYKESAGTSMAAPFVSGIASILSRQFYFPPREILLMTSLKYLEVFVTDGL
jgi:subtilisin family serine protease